MRTRTLVLVYLTTALGALAAAFLVLVVRAPSQALTTTPVAYHENEATMFKMENWSWPCGQTVTWESPDASLQPLIRSIMAEVQSISGIRLREVSPISPSNIVISFNRNQQWGDELGITDSPVAEDGLGTLTSHVYLNPDALTQQYQVMYVLRHEIGHALGLDHVDSTAEVMNPIADFLPDYGPGDRAGLRVLGCQ